MRWWYAGASGHLDSNFPPDSSVWFPLRPMHSLPRQWRPSPMACLAKTDLSPIGAPVPNWRSVSLGASRPPIAWSLQSLQQGQVEYAAFPFAIRIPLEMGQTSGGNRKRKALNQRELPGSIVTAISTFDLSPMASPMARPQHLTCPLWRVTFDLSPMARPVPMARPNGASWGSVTPFLTLAGGGARDQAAIPNGRR
jgi:hypothetical protein